MAHIMLKLGMDTSQLQEQDFILLEELLMMLFLSFWLRHMGHQNYPPIL